MPFFLSFFLYKNRKFIRAHLKKSILIVIEVHIRIRRLGMITLRLRLRIFRAKIDFPPLLLYAGQKMESCGSICLMQKRAQYYLYTYTYVYQTSTFLLKPVCSFRRLTIKLIFQNCQPVFNCKYFHGQANSGSQIAFIIFILSFGYDDLASDASQLYLRMHVV